jgi:hypothetical protein
MENTSAFLIKGDAHLETCVSFVFIIEDIRHPRQALSANQMIYKKRKREKICRRSPQGTLNPLIRTFPRPACMVHRSSSFQRCSSQSACSVILTVRLPPLRPPLLVPPSCETSLSARGSSEISEEVIDDTSTVCCHICLKSECEPCEPPPPFDFTPYLAFMLCLL